MSKTLIIVAGLAVLQILAAVMGPATAACNAATALGVSRVITLDTAAAPRYGQLQYRDHDILKPGEVILTFDDGPLRRYTRRVVEALEAHCTLATFFFVGRMAVSDPAMVREVASKGHTIASHTWSHPNMRTLSEAAAEKELELGISAITAALGRPIAPFFRFPYLADSQRVFDRLKGRAIASFSIDVDSRDFRTGSGDQVRRNIMSQLESRGKGILLFHDIQGSTASGIRQVLDELKAKNYRVVHIVAKVPSSTVASYDLAAEKLLAGKSSGLQMADVETRRTGVIAPVRANQSVQALPKPVEVVTVQPAPRVRPAEEPDWRARVFSGD